jgi:hypothetical protein
MPAARSSNSAQRDDDFPAGAAARRRCRRQREAGRLGEAQGAGLADEVARIGGDQFGQAAVGTLHVAAYVPDDLVSRGELGASKAGTLYHARDVPARYDGEVRVDGAGFSFVATYVAFTCSTFALQGLLTVLAGYRERGILRRLNATPVGAGRLLAGQLTVNWPGSSPSTCR